MRRWLIVMAVNFLLLALVACGGYGAPKRATPTALTTPGEVSVTVSYPSFSPSTITLAKGRATQLKLTSTDVNHTFTIVELAIDVPIGKGQTVTQEIRPDKAGTFTFYCRVPGHREAGMRGTLKVTE